MLNKVPLFMMRTSRPLCVHNPLDELVSLIATKMLKGVIGYAFERRLRQFVMLMLAPLSIS